MDFFEFRKNVPDPTEDGAVFVTGEESYLRGTVVDLLSKEYGFEVHRRTASDCSPSQLDEELQGHSFQEKTRLVCISDPGGSFIREHDDWVRDRVSSDTRQNILLIEAPGVRKNLNIRSWLDTEAIHVTCETPEEKRVEDWVQAFFRSENLRIASETVTKLIDRAGHDLTILREEMEKLALYCRDEGTVRSDHLEEVVIDRSEMDFFEFTDAWLASEYEPVLQEIRRQLLRGESDTKITGSLLWAFRRLRSIIEMSKMGHSPNQISSELGVQKWIVEKTCRQFRSVDSSDLKEMALQFLKKDLASRTGAMEPEIALEFMVMGGLSELSVL